MANDGKVYWRHKGDRTWTSGKIKNLSETMVEITTDHFNKFILKRTEIDIEPQEPQP